MLENTDAMIFTSQDCIYRRNGLNFRHTESKIGSGAAGKRHSSVEHEAAQAREE